MSDERLAQAQAAFSSGKFQEAMALLKGILQDRPEDMEVRNLLMECQAGMMLQLQINEKLKKAKVLLEQGLGENAEKLLQEIIKADPGNQEALALLAPPQQAPSDEDTASFGPTDFEMPAPLELPPLEAEPEAVPDASATDAFPIEGLPSLDAGATGEFPPAGGFAPASDFLSPAEGLPELAPLEGLELPEVSAGGEATVLSGPGGMSPMEQARVRQYLDEGKALQAQGRVQEAIDTWTRVFILDEENQEAQQLIDAARASLSGDQGQIEHMLAEGIAAFNSGQIERARPLLEKVLEIFPGHTEAQYYLERIARVAQPAQAPPPFGAPPPPRPEAPPVQFAPPPAPEAPAPMGFQLDDSVPPPSFGPPPPAPPPPPTFAAPPPPSPFASAPTGPQPKTGPDEFEFEAGADVGGILGPPPGEAAPPPPPPSMAGLPEAPAPATRKMAGSKPVAKGPSMAMIFGGLGAVLVVAVGIFLAMKFMGGDEEPIPVKPAGLPSSAQNAPANAPAPANQPLVPTGPAGATAADFIRDAQAAMVQKDYQQAQALYQQALLREKDNTEAQVGLEQARQLLQAKVEEEARNQKFIKDYTNAIQYYRDGEYKDSLTIAWRLIYPDDTLAKELGKKASIQRLIRDGYFNWAVRDLKNGNARDAEKNLQEVLTVDGADAAAKNLVPFAKEYSGVPPDNLYWETVKTLSLRPFEEVK